VQFRTVAAELTSGLAAAITVADELPAAIRRERLFYGGFTCLYDPRHASGERAIVAPARRQQAIHAGGVSRGQDGHHR